MTDGAKLTSGELMTKTAAEDGWLSLLLTFNETLQSITPGILLSNLSISCSLR